MPALPEYKTRELLARGEVPIVEGFFVAAGSPLPDPLPSPTIYLKAQIPGATSRKAHGLVRRADSAQEIEAGLKELLAPGPWGQAEGVLVAKAADLVGEYYAACLMDFGTGDRLPCGVLLFSPEGGSGVEERAGTLVKLPFPVDKPPGVAEIAPLLGDVDNPEVVARFLTGLARTFCRYKLMVLETNPIGVLADGSLLAIDCRAEFERRAVAKQDMELFAPPGGGQKELTRLERVVARISEADPSGTGFFRQNREPPAKGAWRVATNLCGGGGKMLWEMTTGARKDIYSMNESDTSGGLSAFKSYRVLRAILAQQGAQVLLFTGSGMAFQNQHHLAAAVWKALKESPTPVPVLLRFGGTDEDKAQALIEEVASSLPVPIKTYPAVVFPNAMVDDIASMASESPVHVTPAAQPTGEPTFSVQVPPGDFYCYPERWERDEEPPSVKACPTNFLVWNRGEHRIEFAEGVRCVGCLMCEAASLLEGNGELLIKLSMPKELEQ